MAGITAKFLRILPQQTGNVSTLSLNFLVIGDQALIRILKTILFFNYSTSDNINQ